MPKCKQCSTAFEITSDDLAFYDKVSPVFNGKKELIPPPTLCPECRVQRRFACANDTKLYHRKCDATGRQIIALYTPDNPVPVYDQHVWWSDTWDPKEYSRPFDPALPFFDQFRELARAVPHMSLIVDSNENAEYVNQSGWDKNCYLCFNVEHSQDCFYCYDTYHSRNVIDASYGYQLERCYECNGCKECYAVCYAQNCVGCSDSWYLYDCVGCKYCFGCTGLRQREYCFFNEQLEKGEYECRLQQFHELTYAQRGTIMQRIQDLLLRHPRRATTGLGNEESIGNYLYNCKQSKQCYDSVDLEDCVRCTNVRVAKDCCDVNRWGNAGELCYEGYSVGAGVQRVLFSSYCWDNCSDLYYCNFCLSSRNCFGCAGLRHAQYCILNVQYKKEEYERLVSKIIESMRNTGEWGEFFPVSDSIFGYNETVAQDWYPMMRDDVLKRGWKWHDNTDTQGQYLGPLVLFPERIEDAKDDLPEKILQCEATGRPFKIIPQELKFYREMRLPVPRCCPDERQKRRMALRNPRKLWSRNCAKCQASIQTTYAPDRPETVYCEKCYLNTVY